MASASPAPRKNRGWLIYFLLVGVLAVLAASVIVTYNLSQQLKPEKLAAARKFWEQHGPKSYEMTYTVRLNENDTSDQYHVSVKDGKVVEVTLNGRAQTADRFHNYGMDRLFDYMEEFQDL